MAIASMMCYAMTCDECGEDWGGDFLPHFKSPGAAQDYLRDSGGTVEDGKILCQDCVRKRVNAS